MLNWRELPFVRILLPFIAGILLAFYLNVKIPGLEILLYGLTALVLLYSKVRGLYRYRWLYGAGFSLMFLAFGYSLTLRHNELNDDAHFSKIQTPATENIVAGRVNDAPVKKAAWIKIELKIFATASTPDSLQPCTGNLLLYLARDSAAERLTYGDELVFTGKMSPVEPPKNPNAFDYRRYLHFQNIHYQAFVRGGNWALVKKRERYSVFGTAISLQNHFTETLRKHLDTPNEFSVGAALILGYRDEVPEEILTAYSETGAMHVLAVSGLHVGIVFLILNFFLKRVKWQIPAWRYFKMTVILLAIWAFALVTGASPSVMRAAVMFSFVTVAEAMYRNKNFYNTLTASAFCLLVYNPYWLASVSFQLSYLAVFGIVYFQPKFSRLLTIENKWLDYCWQLTCVSLAAQLMTLPLTLFYFNQFPTYFWLSSLILVPLSGVELGLGLLLFLLEMIWQSGAIWVGKILWAALWLGNQSIVFIQKMPGALMDGIWISANVALVLYLSLSAGMAAISSRKFNWVLSSLTLLLFVSVNYAFTSFRQQKTQRLAVYNIYKHTVIDFFDGTTAYSLVNQDINEKSLGFATEGFRNANGVGEVKTFHLKDTAAHEFDRWFYQNGFIQFYDTRLFVVTKPVAFLSGEKIRVDYLLVRGTPKVTVEDLLEVFDFKTVIFDASNKKWQLEKWKTRCEELGVDYFDINESGAFVLDLRKGLTGWSH
jgi:competence protein ComEC